MNKAHYDNLNGLRTYACLGIIAMHIQANTEYEISGWAWDSFIPSLTLGVYLFLIISGFGMFCGYYQKFKDGTVSLNKFYKKRITKLLPFFSLLILVDIAMERSVSSVIEGLTEITFAFGLLPNNAPSVIGVGWTLGVIFLFYMLFPYIVFLCWTKTRAWIALGISTLLHVFMSIYWLKPQYVVATFASRHNFLYCAVFFISGGILYLYKDSIERFANQYRWIMRGVVLVAIVLFYIANRIMGTSWW